MRRVAIVDTGLSNLDSVRRALEECGADPFVTNDPIALDGAARIVLPGIGSFGDGMAALRERRLDVSMAEQVVGRGVPFLGICLGLQLLARVGTEGSITDGLGWIEGEVVRLEPTPEERRVPHMGWNEVHATRDSVLLAGLPGDADFYFVHSYRLRCDHDLDSVATTPYCGGFTSVVERGNVFATQFHPEKSQRHGFAVLRNFLAA